jgi:hypothetical protein
MTLVLSILAGWFVLSVVVGIGIGRAARLGSEPPRLGDGLVDPAHTGSTATVPTRATAPQQRRHSGPAAA